MTLGGFRGRRTPCSWGVGVATMIFLTAGVVHADQDPRDDDGPTPTPTPIAPTPIAPAPAPGPIADPSPPPSSAPPSMTAPPAAKQEYDEPLVTGTARFSDRFYELGLFVGAGGPLAVAGLAGMPTLAGVRVQENHGYISKFTIAFLLAMGQGNSRYVGSSYSTDSKGNVWRTDYYRPKSAAEREADRRAMSAAISAEYLMEMAVYGSVPWGKNDTQYGLAKGFELYLGGEVPIGGPSDLPTILQIAFACAYVRGDTVQFKPGQGRAAPTDGGGNAPGVFHDLYYSNIGLMLRANIPFTRWAEAYVHWDLNFLTLFDLSGKKVAEKGYVWTSPLRAGLNFNVTDRAYLRAHGSLNGLSTQTLGWAGEVGVRF